MSDNSGDDDDNLDLDENGEELDEETRQKKRRERLEQNRISARESRKRKKNMIEELQRTVITLSREHKELGTRNETLKQQLMELSNKVRLPGSSLSVPRTGECLHFLFCLLACTAFIWHF
jgi:predicted RNase H-like nuclease (RuvC/YqgF family)